MFKLFDVLKRGLGGAAAGPTPAAPVPAVSLPAAPWNTESDFIHEDQFELGTLIALFRRVMLSFEIDADSLVVETESAHVRVMIDTDRKILVMRTLYRFRDSSDHEARLRLANRLNASLILVRFSVVDDDMLYADYCLLYQRGLPAFHIVNSLRRFALVACNGLRECDSEDLIA